MHGAITWNAPDPQRFTALHIAAQADVLMGKNVFFVNFGENFVSPHAAVVGDSCAPCHVKLSPAGHTFKPDKKTLYANGHGPTFKAEFMQLPMEALIEDLAQAISARAMAAKGRIATIGSWDPTTDQTVANFRVNAAEITGFEPTESHGQMGLTLKMAGGRELHTLFANIFANIKDGSGAVAFPTRDPIVRASWTSFMFHSDGSKRSTPRASTAR